MVVLADKIALPDDVGDYRQDQLNDIEGDDKPEAEGREPMAFDHGFIEVTSAP